MLTNNPCLHSLRFFCTPSIFLSSFSNPFNFQDFECNVNRIRWVIPDWNIIKDFHWLLPHLENYLFSPNFSLTLNTLKNTTPQNLVYACPTRFVSFQQPDTKSNMVHVCFVLKTYITLCKYEVQNIFKMSSFIKAIYHLHLKLNNNIVPRYIKV